MKLIMQTVPVGKKCKLCENIDVKMRRRAAEVERVNRWQREGNKFQASIKKSMEGVKNLDAEIYELGCERNRRLQGIGSQEWDDAERAETQTDQRITSQARMVLKKQTRQGLPITFELADRAATVMASPDFGSDENAISLELTLKLGLDMEQVEDKSFRMANGKVFWCCGRTVSACGFGTESHLGPKGLMCTFYVFRTLASPLVMCMSFLERTQTLTVFRSRLVNLAISTFAVPRVLAIGNPHKRLTCSIDGEVLHAIPDSGSEVDLMSENYAQRRGLAIIPKCSRIMFADGSIGKTCGIVSARLCIGSQDVNIAEIWHTAEEVTDTPSSEALDGETNRPYPNQVAAGSGLANMNLSNRKVYRKVLLGQFHIMKDLRTDVLIGEESLESLDVFTDHLEDIVDTGTELIDMANFNRIVLLGSVEHAITDARVRVSRRITRAFRQGIASRAENASQSFEQGLNERDQRENARREKENARLATLPIGERAAAELAEEARQKLYDRDRALDILAFEASRRH